MYLTLEQLKAINKAGVGLQWKATDRWSRIAVQWGFADFPAAVDPTRYRIPSGAKLTLEQLQLAQSAGIHLQWFCDGWVDGQDWRAFGRSSWSFVSGKAEQFRIHPKYINGGNYVENDTQTDTGKFWMVLGAGVPTVRHDSYARALQEAERLSNLNGNKAFYVLEAVTKVETIITKETHSNRL